MIVRKYACHRGRHHPWLTGACSRVPRRYVSVDEARRSPTVQVKGRVDKVDPQDRESLGCGSIWWMTRNHSVTYAGRAARQAPGGGTSGYEAGLHRRVKCPSKTRGGRKPSGEPPQRYQDAQ